MGRWIDGKGRLAHREGIRQKHWSGAVGAARFGASVCEYGTSLGDSFVCVRTAGAFKESMGLLARTLAVRRILLTFTPPMRRAGYRCFCNGLKPPKLSTSCANQR